jgi:hypothetical protein
MLTPTEKVESSSNGQPGMDGFDATTGAYMAFTVGTNQSFLPDESDALGTHPVQGKGGHP